MFGASFPGVLRAGRGDSVAEERKTPFSRPEAGEEGGAFDEEQTPGSAMLSPRRKSKEIQREEEGLFCTGRPGAVNTRGR